MLLLQRWVVRYGLITLGTDLVLREFPQVMAHLVRLTSNEVSFRVLVVHASYAFPLEYSSSNLMSL